MRTSDHTTVTAFKYKLFHQGKHIIGKNLTMTPKKLFFLRKEGNI